MKNSYKIGLAAIAASLALVGCGGGSSSSTTSTPSTVTGQFIDGPVSGLNYTCDPSGKSDVTNVNGEYTCNTGDTVTFSLGSYVLGSTTASSGIVTPYDITDNVDEAVNVARLLQSIDTDDNPDTITIDGNFTALDDSTADLNATCSDFADAIFADSDENVTVDVGCVQAQENMDNDVLYALFSGKTLYMAEYEPQVGDDFIDEWVFNTDVTEANVTEVTPGAVEPYEEGFTATIDAGTLILEPVAEDAMYTLTLVAQNETYIEVSVAGEEGTVKFYYNQADAEAYYYEAQEELIREILANKTWQSTAFDAVQLTFNNDMTSVLVLDADSDIPFPVDIVLDGNTITHDEGTDIVTLTGPDEFYMNMGTAEEEFFYLVESMPL